MLRFYFWVLKGPNCTKNFEPRSSHFGDMGVKKFQLSHLFPQNWVSISPYFVQCILGMTPIDTESFVKVSQTIFEIFGIFHFPKVSNTLITESLYSDEYSLTWKVHRWQSERWEIREKKDKILLTRDRTCWSGVKYAEVIFAHVPSAVFSTDTCVPDHDHRLVRVLAGASTTDLDDCSHATLATVLVIPLPVIATYDAQTHRYSSARLQTPTLLQHCETVISCCRPGSRRR